MSIASCAPSRYVEHRADMTLALIAALARNRVIGYKGATPWHLPEDLARFRSLTMGHAVLMGRTTYAALGHPLPGRETVVITSRPFAGVRCFPSPGAALDVLQTHGRVFVAGGGRLYAALLSRADELYLTLIDRDVPGDTFFPAYEDLVRTSFVRVFYEQHEGFVFADYLRARRTTDPLT